MKQAYLTYAINNVDGKLVHVDCVPNGNECGCICPHCGYELCAKNGGDDKKKIHHFAHQNGAECVGAVESALHMMAKEVLSECRCLQLPNNPDGSRGKQLSFDAVDVELYDKETGLRPDCIGYYGNNVLWIEFKRTHEVDDTKRGKILSAKVDCIEIDINSCELNPLKILKFITEESSNRIWIREKETRTEAIEEQIHDFYGSCDIFNVSRFRRIFARDENGKLVNLLCDETNETLHSYFCLSCGKKLTFHPDAGRKEFVHKRNKCRCSDDIYLREAAKEILCNKFNSSNKFEIVLPQNLLCGEKDKCKFYSQIDCCKRDVFQYNLKEHGYTDCVKDYIFLDKKYKCDLIIKRNHEFDEAIIICIKTTECCVEANVENYRMIEINVQDDLCLERLADMPFKYPFANFRGFNTDNKNVAKSTDIQRHMYRFQYFASGKYYLDTISCTSLQEHKHTAIVEYYYKAETPQMSAKMFSLLKCYMDKRKACYCEICFLLSCRNLLYGRGKAICKSYKKKGTPKYPLDSKPMDCPYFILNKSIENAFRYNYHKWNITEYVIDEQSPKD